MRYLVTALGLMAASSAQAGTDLGYIAESYGAGAPITKLRLEGSGIWRRYYDDMCILMAPCELPPEQSGEGKFDITFSFAPVSRQGRQEVTRGIVVQGGHSIVFSITFQDGDFVRAYGYRDPGGYGCNYMWTEEVYTAKEFSYIDMWCTHVPGEYPDYGIKNYESRSGKITAIYINDVRVPEPATWAMLISGFALIGAAIRRRRSEGRYPAVRWG